MTADWRLFFWCGVFVCALVYALILFPLWRWRRRDDSLPPQFKRNNALEITYTVIPFAMVVGLFVFTFDVERRVEALQANPPLTVDVTAFRWGWRFAYEGHRAIVQSDAPNAPELVLPVATTTQVVLRSVDVIHSFWIPDFLFKRDAIPGFVNRFDLRPIAVGSFRGECGEFCGLEHANMTFSVRVVRADEFSRWLSAADARAGAKGG